MSIVTQSSTCAVIVTRNRREMLRQCLAAVEGQTAAPDRVLVVDNASTDGTGSMLREGYPQVDVLTLSSNEGGAGGFHAGIKSAYEAGAEWIWLLDDDTIPSPEALAELLRAAKPLDGMAEPTLLASLVRWRDGRVHPMNFPTLERRRMERVIAGAERGVMPMRSASFVSLLVRRSVVDRFGLPLKHFFLWSDDIEYTSRAVLGGEIGYFVPASVALHDTPTPDAFKAAPPDRFYFHVRNTVFMARQGQRPRTDRLIRTWVVVASSTGYLARHRNMRALVAVMRGFRDGLRTRARGGP